MKPIYITGFGISSSIGRGKDRTLNSLRNNISGIAPIKGIKGLHKPLLGAQITRSTSEIAESLGLTGSIDPISRTTAIGIDALSDLLDTVVPEMDDRTALLNASSVGGMDTTELEHLNGKESDHKVYLQHPIGNVTDNMCGHFGWNVFRTTISTACSSAANAIMMGARMIHSGNYERIIAGGCDALSLFTIRGFDSLMIYDEEHCRPFDIGRKGLNLGEGAAYLLLEDERSMLEAGRKPLAELTGWANANDAYHQTASSPEGRGAYDSMNQALSIGNIDKSMIHYVNAHGTATPNNDLSEAIALNRTFDEVPPFSSTKYLTGHTLAAAGALEAVFSILAIEEQTAWGMPMHKDQMEDPGSIPLKMNTSIPINGVLSNSFGFGGNNSTLIFGKA